MKLVQLMNAISIVTKILTCILLCYIHVVSAGMASIDSSAPETNSSDNSPTLVRKSWGKHHGPGSDSGSSGKSSDSFISSSSGDKIIAKIHDEIDR